MARHHANRGQQFEEYLNYIHRMYKSQKRALIEKVPTEWKPLRNGTGKIVSAKVEHKAIVDYLGIYKSMPIAFDAKHTLESRIELRALEPHQADFLRLWMGLGGISLVLVSFNMQYVVVVPFEFWDVHSEAWKAGGAASIPLDKFPPTWFAQGGDYLKVVDRFLAHKLGDEDRADGTEINNILKAFPEAAAFLPRR